MISFNKFLVPTAVAASMLVAACGSSSHSSTSNSPAASPTPSSGGSAPATVTGLTLGTAKGPMGAYLVGASGRALYAWVADHNGMSSCTGACAKAWPPLLAKSTPQLTGGLNAADVSLITRSDGSDQVAYMGHPLYYFVADTRAGMTSGEGSDGFGAKWWLVAPSGSEITTGGSAASASSTGSSNPSTAGASSAGSSAPAAAGASSGGSSGGSGWGSSGGSSWG